jgi:uncharacterized DUF497 family protein
MRIEFDRIKRDRTLITRGLDFARAGEVFDGPVAHTLDLRKDYGELRIETLGMLDKRWIMVVWTPRSDARRIISMRYANGREIKLYSGRVR